MEAYGKSFGIFISVADVYYIITVRQILLCRFPKKSFGGNAIMTGRCSKTLNKSLVLINLT